MDEPTRRRTLGLFLLAAAATRGGAAQARTQDGAGQDGAGQIGFRQTGDKAVQRSIEQKLRDLPICPEDFGAVGDGVHDDSDAFDAAIVEAMRRHNATIWLSAGRSYRITRTLRMRQGVVISGPGSQGSTTGFGCSIRHFSNDDLFVWDGSGEEYAGTGGGLRNVLITKAPSFAGGTAIRLVSTRDDHRPGEMLFENVLAYGERSGGQQGLWDHGLIIDGSASDVAGARGVRSTRWFGCRFAGCRVPQQTMVLRQATHAYFVACAVDESSGQSPGLWLEGHNDDIHFTAMALGGALTIAPNNQRNSLRNFTYSGKIGAAFVNQDAEAEGMLSAVFEGTYALVNKSPGLKLSTNLNPAFLLATNGGRIASGGGGDLVWQSEVHDQGNNFRTPDNGYKCIAAGLHQLSATLALQTGRAGRAEFEMRLTHRPADGAPRAFSRRFASSSGQPGEVISADLSITLDLRYGDRVGVSLIDLKGNAGAILLGDTDGVMSSWFEGRLIPG